MSKNNNRGLFNTIQNFLLSYDGKTALNFAYSWGAAIVILGALFKLTHLPGANLMLYIGMGTEVLVFLISAFERPEKTYRWESIFPNLEITGKELKGECEEEAENLLEAQAGGETVSVRGVQGASPSVVYFGGGNGSPGAQGAASAATGEAGMAAATGGAAFGGGGIVGGGIIGSAVSPAPNIPAEEMEDVTKDYLEKLKEMTETVGRLNKQMGNFVCDPEQMQGVNRHIAGLNAIFELQLRSASKQVESVDKVHEQTEKMAAQIEELNKVYARMLQAMTTNMMNQQPTNQ